MRRANGQAGDGGAEGLRRHRNLVVDRGRIIERGDFKGLAAQGGH